MTAGETLIRAIAPELIQGIFAVDHPIADLGLGDARIE